jgi:hypothetical protein
MRHTESECANITYGNIQKITLCVSCSYLAIVIARQFFGTTFSKQEKLLPLYLRIFVVTLGVDVFYGVVVFIYGSHMPYYMAALTQGLGNGISFAVGIYLCQKSAGSSAIRNAAAGGLIIGMEKSIFVLAVNYHLEGPPVSSPHHSHSRLRDSSIYGTTGTIWLYQDAFQCAAYAGLLLYARLQEETRPGSMSYCLFQCCVSASFLVMGILLHDHAITYHAAECWQISTIAFAFTLWPFILYYALKADSTFWRVFPLQPKERGASRSSASSNAYRESFNRPLLDQEKDLHEAVQVRPVIQLHSSSLACPPAQPIIDSIAHLTLERFTSTSAGARLLQPCDQ